MCTKLFVTARSRKHWLVGKESFLNNLVKMFQLPALTLALGTGRCLMVVAIKADMETGQRELKKDGQGSCGGSAQGRAKDRVCPMLGCLCFLEVSLEQHGHCLSGHLGMGMESGAPPVKDEGGATRGLTGPHGASRGRASFTSGPQPWHLLMPSAHRITPCLSSKAGIP